ncbi:MAG: aminotransferase class IV [Nitrospinota bacterium]|jgi:branched-chain amino acid aminotransferase|nr:aminotransferase class IV [Nitrospinota bacterium]MDP7661932.1 aminotransferase class IV [Nitrospinota bacterium]
MNKEIASFVILNGDVVPANEASLPVDDRGFLYGESVFTTIRCYGGVPFRVNRHFDRLNASLTSPVMEIDHKLDPAKLETDIRQLLELNKCPDAAARFTITRGCAPGPLPPRELAPTALLSVRPYVPDTSLPGRGASLCISTVRRDPAGELGKHKLGSYYPSILARRQAFAKGHDEAVICDTDGNFLECACSNLFAVRDGILLTPDVRENILPGIAREAVLECAAAIGLKTSFETLTPEIRTNAKEWFITNSLLEIVPVARLAENIFPVPGPATGRLLNAYKDLVTSETLIAKGG